MCGIVGWLLLAGLTGPGEPGRPCPHARHHGPPRSARWTACACCCNARSASRSGAVDHRSVHGRRSADDQRGRYGPGGLQRRDLQPPGAPEELQEKGHRFKTDHSDTEVILHGDEEWGETVVERLDGMFAIAIWDGRAGGSSSRETASESSRSTSWTRAGWLFGSEIKALLAHPDVEADSRRALSTTT